MSKRHKPEVINTRNADFDWLRFAPLILSVFILICYWQVSDLDITQLDDTVFINDKYEFISNLSNLPKTFTQGCFNEKDIYYRPMLVIYFMLVIPFTSPTSIVAFHIASIAFHLLNTLLLFYLLQKIINNRYTAFVLSLLFAVHPALTMTVAWIPGINDLLLTTFSFSYFITLLNIKEKGRPLDVALNFLFILLCLLTKETAAFIPIAGIMLLWFKNYLKPVSKMLMVTLTLNIVAWILWFIARKNVAPDDAPPLIDGEILILTAGRSIALLQYLGKCLLPFNLNVYPTLNDTTIWFGVATALIISVGILLNKNRNYRNILFGTWWFVLFLLPVFLVPAKINNQLFEHRLYLPMMGFLILLNETILFSDVINKIIRQVILAAIVIGSIILIHNYIPAFKDIFSFWENAINNNPNDGCANKMYGMKLIAVNQKELGLQYMFKARSINETEPYTGLFISQYYYEPKGDIDSARLFLELEVKDNPKIWQAYYELARICYTQKDLNCAEENLVKFLEYNPKDQKANFNLTLLYFDKKKYKESFNQANIARKRGAKIDDVFYNMIVDSMKVHTQQ